MFFCVCMVANQIFGQSGLPSDTLTLRVFEKTEWRYERLRKHTLIREADSASISFHRLGDISSLLQNVTTLHLRTYGPGYSGAVSSRGLAGAHTAIYWNGINLQSPASGIADISLIPAAFIESIGFNSSGVSGISGSGALAGGIHLNPRSRHSDGVQARWSNTWSSQHNFETSLQVSAGDSLMQSMTNVLYSDAQNAFRFVNHAHRDKPVDTREGSYFAQRGFTQEVSRKWGAHELSISVWALQTRRKLAPGLTSVDNDEYQEDMNLKGRLNWSVTRQNWKAQVQTAFLFDELAYRNSSGVSSLIAVNQVLFSADFERNNAGRLTWFWGFSGNNQQARTENFGNEGAFMAQWGIYAAARFENVKTTILSELTLRQDFFPDCQHPFSPAWSLELNPYARLKWKTSVARNFRVPAMNDRFWIPGGDRDLPPEDAWSLQTGPEIRILKKRKLEMSAAVVGFYNHINHWIQWVSGAENWRAVSYKSVNSQGAELNLNLDYAGKRTEFRCDANYTFLKVVNSESQLRPELQGSFLPHVPQHRMALNTVIIHRRISVYTDAGFTSSRFTSSDNTGEMPAFWLVNSGLSYSFYVGTLTLTGLFRVHNLLNQDYQIMPWMPMPLRNYSLTFQIGLNK